MNMKRLLLLSILLIVSAGVLKAQNCGNLTMTLEPTHSTCIANGKIKVNIGGSDVANIDPDRVEFMVTGAVNLPFSTYADNTIQNLAAGTYTITLRAFCNLINDWVIASATATTTLTTSYRELVISLGTSRASLNCKPTGMIPVNITAGTGSAPYTIDILSAPATYEGATTFSVTGSSQLTDLAGGTYTIKVTDNCGYEIDRTFTVGLMEQDYFPDFFGPYFYRTLLNPFSCNDVSFITSRNVAALSPDEQHYFYYNITDYFEFAAVVNNVGARNYQPITTPTNGYMAYILPTSVTLFRQNGDFITPYLRVKGTNCEFQLNNVSIRDDIRSNISSYTTGCSNYIIHYPDAGGRGLICFPYQWRIVDSENNTFLDWQGPVENYNEVRVSDVPSGLFLECIDNDGYQWRRSIPVTVSNPYLSVTTGSYYLGADGYYSGNISFYLDGFFPSGTRFQFVSGPTTPIHTDLTITNSLRRIYPFLSNHDYSTVGGSSNDFTYILPGIYTFTVSMPGCPIHTLTANYSADRLIEPFTYTTYETCDGLYVKPTGGRIDRISHDGSVTANDIYYSIHSSQPSNLSYDTRVIQSGDSLKLPQAGTYHIAMNTRNSRSYWGCYLDTITYIPSVFTLDDAVTSAYVCQDEVTGFIKVRGKDGSGNYSYDLYDGGTLVDTNTTGVFNYGTPGSTYTVVLKDETCLASYPQNVTLLDLSTAVITYTEQPGNQFCNTDSVYLKCITLGETTYNWSGPGINASNENDQNPALSAADIGIGTHTYTISVAPEFCGTPIIRTLVITVANCGAVDDYKTIFANTTDTIHILDNDLYLPSCASSVNPVITMEPKHGTYTMENKKIVYTPDANFIGADSMKYSVTCGTNTTATVYINVICAPSTPDFTFIGGDWRTFCIGDQISITVAMTTPGSIANPVFKWYDNASGGTLLYEGPTFTPATALLTPPDVTFYVSVEGDGYCASRERRKVAIFLNNCDEMAKKSATLLPNTFVDNGSYPNPISILGNEVVRYKISATNPTNGPAKILITDTLPAYFQFVSGTDSTAATLTNTTAPPNPVRQVLKWEFPSVPVNGSRTVAFNATPQSGAVASQPLFINRAMVSFVRSPGDTVHIQTNGTFHQGAGISITTFSAGYGGNIYNAGEQALDYMTTPKSGIVIAPDEGYRFAGWSHDDYASLRGVTVAAQEGIMLYDTLTVYGNVELHANFKLEKYPVHYHLNGGSNAESNPAAYTIESEWAIIVQHENNYLSIYKNNARLLRKAGDTVKAGETIAIGPNITNNTAEQFYFELWKDGHAVNPEEYIIF